LLRIPEEAQKEEARDAFRRDLERIRTLAA
jgi:hypothetical protein